MVRKTKLIYVIVISILLSVLMVPAFAAPTDPTEYDSAAVTKIMNKTNVFELKAKASVLMEPETGTILMESNSHEKLSIASVTKVMSMLLIMEAIDSGKITFDSKVPVSEYAAGMGGSQAYLKPGEEFTVSEMMKAIAVHSSNDVTVAMAEFVAGSESTFVQRMNERAKELGMKDTNFLDCTGLTDEGHYSSAHDVALMSRELIVKHPKILEYTSIWHDTFRDGTFSLDNTNKLIRFYQGADGLKTGFTSKAGHNLSATAKRNDMRLLSVVLGEPDSNTRFAESRKLLDYGFANFQMAKVNNRGDEVGNIPVKKGVKPQVRAIYREDVKLLVDKGQKAAVEREIRLAEDLTAPIQAGQKVGEVVFKLNGGNVGKADLVAETGVEKATFGKLFFKMVVQWFGIGRKAV